MKIVAGLFLALITGAAAAAGIYEFDQSQWEKKPAAATEVKKQPVRQTGAPAATPATRTAASQQPATGTTATDSAATENKAPAATTDSGDVAQSHDCPPGHTCNDLH
mgnify:FL=1